MLGCTLKGRVAAPQILLDRSDRLVDRSDRYSQGFLAAGLTGCLNRSDRLCIGRSVEVRECRPFSYYSNSYLWSCKTCKLCMYLNQLCKIVVFKLVLKRLWFFPFPSCRIISSIYHVCTICARLRVKLPVLFRSGRGLRKDHQIKPLS